MPGSQHKQQVACFHDIDIIRLTSSLKRKIMVCYRTTLASVTLFISRKQSPAFGLPQIKEFSRLFVEKANEVRLFVRVLAGCSSSLVTGRPNGPNNSNSGA